MTPPFPSLPSIVITVLLASALGCARFDVPPPRVVFPWQGIADVAPAAPMVPLAAPNTPLRAERGRAALAYPASFAIAIRPDGAVTFPKDTVGQVRGASVFVDSTALATLDDAGVVSGGGLKRKYTFNEKGDLVDDLGRGVRVGPDGHVRALGRSVRYQNVLVWRPETRGERWDYVGWRTLSILSLLLLENTLPETVGLTEASQTFPAAKAAPARKPRGRQH